MIEFEGVTISAKAADAVSAPSLTVIVIGATPAWPTVGVTVSVRLLPWPPKVRWAGSLGTSSRLLLAAARLSESAAVSISPKLNAKVTLVAALAKRLVLGM